MLLSDQTPWNDDSKESTHHHLTAVRWGVPLTSSSDPGHLDWKTILQRQFYRKIPKHNTSNLVKLYCTVLSIKKFIKVIDWRFNRLLSVSLDLVIGDINNDYYLMSVNKIIQKIDRYGNVWGFFIVCNY